jgi:hypothetical protein
MQLKTKEKEMGNLNDSLLDINQLAGLLSIKPRTVRDWCFRGKVNGIIVRVGKLIRFDPYKVQARLQKGKILD